MVDSIVLEGLTITSPKKTTNPHLVDQVSLRIPKGKIVGIIGESGSGKSLTVKTIMGIAPESVTVHYEKLEYEGQAVKQADKLPIAMIFQDPMTSLNPLRTIGFHLEEIIKRYTSDLDKKDRKKKMVAILERVGIPQAESRLDQYPFEFSGGMRQRILIAMALLSEPQVLIADEPTTALDVTIQAQILALIKELQETMGLTVVLVSHDFGVIASLCDEIKVMRSGQIVEEGTIEDIFDHPLHPYTKQLLAAARLETREAIEADRPSKTSQLVAVSDTHRVRKEV